MYDAAQRCGTKMRHNDAARRRSSPRAQLTFFPTSCWPSSKKLAPTSLGCAAASSWSTALTPARSRFLHPSAVTLRRRGGGGREPRKETKEGDKESETRNTAVVKHGGSVVWCGVVWRWRCTAGWIDGWTDGLMDGWMDGCKGGWMDDLGKHRGSVKAM